jgi:hypothetical protein
MNPKNKTAILLLIALPLLFALAFAFTLISYRKQSSPNNEHIGCTPEKHVCVMKTIFELQQSPVHLKTFNELGIPSEAKASIEAGLLWISKAQLPDGGWGAGFHTRQHVTDPHAVAADPATNALVSLSLLRTGNSLESGTYKKQLVASTKYLLERVEKWPQDQPRLTTFSGTQPQQKLEENIDAILTVQYLTTLLKYHANHPWKERIEKALKKCVSRIEKEQDSDGGWKGGGWAPVLQSALADQALESAKDAGLSVDSAVMAKSKLYQKSNFDTATKSALTGKAAGVMLYSLSSTARSSAKEAKKAKMILEKGKRDGKIKPTDKLDEITLVQAGSTPAEAKELVTAYQINESTKMQSLSEEVMEGFGSNGGEEFLSYLQTGESILLQDGNEWKQWYENMSKKIIGIQLKDGNWEGHHCITSSVFCTATALLILSIHDDLDGFDQRRF